MIRRKLLLGLLATASFAACGDGEGTSTLQVHRKPADIDGTAELARKHQMQAVTVVGPDGAEVWTVENLGTAVAFTCHAQLDAELADPNSAVNDSLVPCTAGPVKEGSTYDGYWEELWADVCAIDFGTRIADGRPVSVTSDVPGVGVQRYELGAQSSATRAAFARRALADARLRAHEALRDFPAHLAGCPDVGLLASLAAEYFRSSHRAGEKYRYLALAVSDAERGTTPDRELAAYRAMSSTELSRFAAVSSLIGGHAQEEWGEYFQYPGGGTGFCTSSRLTPQGEAALRILRESALPPDVVLMTEEFVPGSRAGADDIPTAQMLDGNWTWGGVRQRLQTKWNRAIEAPNGLAAYFGLTNADFDEARSYLGHELLAFSRSNVQTAGAWNAEMQRYPATETPPTDRDPAYYSAVARSAPRITYDWQTPGYGHAFDVHGWGYAIAPSGDYACASDKNQLPIEVRNYRGVRTGAGLSASRELAAEALECDIAALGPDYPDEITPFIALAQDLRSGYEGSVEHCNNHVSWPNTGVHFTGTGVRVIHPQSGYGYRVVRGEDALNCYTSRTVEGAPCEALEAARRANWIRFELMDDGTGVMQASVAQDDTDVASLSLARWYVLKTREPTEPSTDESGGAYWNVGPGGWESVSGFTPRAPLPPREPGDTSNPFTSCRRMPIYRDIENSIVEIFKPSSDWCTEPATTCVGLGSRDPLPLEDELTADGDKYEGSWKHYLSLAKDAAAYSDQLAASYLDYGVSNAEFTMSQEEKALAREEQAVAALEQVQQLCGTHVDPSILVKALGGGKGAIDLTNLYEDPETGGNCTPGSTNQPGSIYDCVNSRLVINWRKMLRITPELKPLADCLLGEGDLSGQSTQDFVHLGDAGLCVPDAALTGTCGHADEAACSETLVSTNDSGGIEGCQAQDGETYTLVPASSGLSFFNTRKVVETTKFESVCPAVREARRTHSKESIEKLRSSMTLALPKLKEIARVTRVDPRYGMYVGISMGGGYWETGTTEGGPNVNHWPCAATQRPADCVEGDKSLFCTEWDCANVGWRAVANERLIRATRAAQLSLWSPDLGELKTFLPTHLFGGVRPRDNGTWTIQQVWRPGNEPLPVAKFESDRWTIFEGDTSNLVNEQDKWAWLSHFNPDLSSHITWNLRLENVSKPTSFAFSHWEEYDIPYLSDKFWAGFNFAGSSDGCMLKALKGLDSPMKECSGGEPSQTEKQDEIFCDTGIDLWKAAGLTKPPDVALSKLECGENEYLAGQYASNTFDYEESADIFLDGLELLCMAQERTSAFVDCSQDAPELRRVEDLGLMGAYLECAGRKITNKGATAVFRNLPKAVLDPFRASGNGVYDSASGEVGLALSDLRTALMDIYTIQSTIGHTVKQFGSEMKALQSAFHGFAADGEVLDVEFESSQFSQATACAAAASNVAGGDSAIKWGKAGAAAATCANSIAQIRFADRLRGLKKAGLEATKEGAIARFNESFDTKSQILDEQSTELSKALERINTAVGRIGNMRTEAERIFSDAIWHMTRQAKSTTALANALSNREAIAKERYERAEQNARRVSYLAKRAIEQRLGVHLDEMTDALPLVEAPASWESSICTSSGLDFAILEKSMSKEGISAAADSFIGDYVRKLENVVESYRLVQGFQDGSDVAVVSLKDDVLGVREVCEVPSRNLLKRSDELGQFAYGWSSDRVGWYLDNCSSTTTDGVSVLTGNCFASSSTGEVLLPTGGDQLSPAFTFTFGNGGTSSGPCSGGTGECGWTTSTALGQRVSLKAGSYAFSWYEKRGDNEPEAVHPVVAGLGQQAVETTLAMDRDVNFAGWIKRSVVFNVNLDGDAFVGFSAGEAEEADYRSTGTVAAPMLEALSDNHAAQGSSAIVGFYESTDAAGNARVRACGDEDGSEFRQSWKRGCMNICPDGYSSDCREFTKQACYHEIAFPITQRSIESGSQFAVSGFASGNFNYRINRIGLNVVGTGTRNCTATAGQACYAAGFATYTMEHQGPYLVRNHQGADYRAALTEGRIEHARAVAAERYLTNPISSTDKSLLEEYMRREMAGRPLNGTFVLRVWDDAGLDFSAIEDIQLVLDYGYWTRLQ